MTTPKKLTPELVRNVTSKQLLKIKRRSWTIDLTESPLREEGFRSHLAQLAETGQEGLQEETTAPCEDERGVPSEHVAHIVRSLNDLSDEELKLVLKASQGLFATRRGAAARLMIETSVDDNPTGKLDQDGNRGPVKQVVWTTATKAAVFVFFILVSWALSGSNWHCTKVAWIMAEAAVLVAITGPNQRS